MQGTCFYNHCAREIDEANGWKRPLSKSTKVVNILGGYGYRPALADMTLGDRFDEGDITQLIWTGNQVIVDPAHGAVTVAPGAQSLRATKTPAGC